MMISKFPVTALERRTASAMERTPSGPLPVVQLVAPSSTALLVTTQALPVTRTVTAAMEMSLSASLTATRAVRVPAVVYACAAVFTVVHGVHGAVPGAAFVVPSKSKETLRAEAAVWRSVEAEASNVMSDPVVTPPGPDRRALGGERKTLFAGGSTTSACTGLPPNCAVRLYVPALVPR